ncbi:hypothetical protein MMC13_005859 [Lambiella insularis]|nr:hypothetical protein [Lambiella insularis]
MRIVLAFLALVRVCTVNALENLHTKFAKFNNHHGLITAESVPVNQTLKFLTNKTAPFAVNGSALPKFNFNIGESYSGTLSIDANPCNSNRLWFWFFPSDNPAASDEITVWLNGGPGCSSLDGLLQENGPFSWQSGTFRPIKNIYAWTNLTNMVWIDQPVSTGYSPGNIVVNNEDDVAKQFNGFWKNFMTTFGLRGRKVFLAGESYAGQYISYIASHMLDANDTEYYNVKGIQINDPLINYQDAQAEGKSRPTLCLFRELTGSQLLSYLEYLNDRADICGYTQFMAEALVFPPTGPLPTAPDSSIGDCDLLTDYFLAAKEVNPCYNIYHILDFCPYLWDEIGYPGPARGPNNYFNRSDVQKVLHAPPTNFIVCAKGPNLFPQEEDGSVPSALGPLPSVIDRTNNVLIGHGLLDSLLYANGTLLSIQNMTWNGKQGFQTAPSAPFLVPYHPDSGSLNPPIGYTNFAGSGILGTTHTERGLTFTTVNTAGHMIAQYAPGAAYRMLEFLLGRIESLSQTGDFTTQTGNFTA